MWSNAVKVHPWIGSNYEDVAEAFPSKDFDSWGVKFH
jgi:hypothetical protein